MCRGLIPFSLLLSACAPHYYYMPNVQNVPLLQDKNDFRLTASSSGANNSVDNISGSEFQGAFALTKKLGVMANYMQVKGGDSQNGGDGKYMEAGAGYYRTLEKHIVFEVYGGFGEGRQHHNYQTKIDSSTGFVSSITKYKNGGTSELSFAKFFIQPALGLTYKGFDISLSERISGLSFFKIQNNADTANAEWKSVNDILRNKNSFLLETAITLRGGWKYVKLQLQFMSSSNISHPYLHFVNGTTSLGICFVMAKNYRKFSQKRNLTPSSSR